MLHFFPTQQRQKQKHKSGREESNTLISAVRGGIFLCKEVDNIISNKIAFVKNTALKDKAL